MLLIDNRGKHRTIEFGMNLIGFRYTSLLLTPEEIITANMSDEDKIKYIKHLLYSRESKIQINAPPILEESITINRCEKRDCNNIAEGALALKLYPFKVIQNQYNCNDHVSMLILGLKACKKCLEELKLKPSDIMPDEDQRALGRLNKNGFEIDPRLTVVELVPFDHPDYIRYLSMAKGETVHVEDSTDQKSSSEGENPASSS